MSRNFGSDEELEFEGNITRTSGKAYEFQADDWDQPEWIPKSQCTMVPVPDSDTVGRCHMFIKKWLVEKNGWLK